MIVASLRQAGFSNAVHGATDRFCCSVIRATVDTKNPAWPQVHYILGIMGLLYIKVMQVFLVSTVGLLVQLYAKFQSLRAIAHVAKPLLFLQNLHPITWVNSPHGSCKDPAP